MVKNCPERSFYIMASKFYLHQGKNKKAENGRPWIYIDEINEYDGDYENGDIVEVYNHKNYFIGKGYINLVFANWNVFKFFL